MKKYSSLFGLIGLLLVIAGLVRYYLEGVFTWMENAALIAGTLGIIVYLIFNFVAVKERLLSRSTLQTTNAVFMSVIVVGVLGLINFIAGQHVYRHDTTAAKLFSLSDQTKKVLTSLQKDLHITAFYKAEGEGKIKDLFEEYTKISPKFNYEFVDPDRKPEIAKSKGITAYETSVISYGPKDEKITTATEEDLTNAIIKVTRAGVKKVYFTMNHGEKSPGSEDRLGLNLAQSVIKQKNFEVGSISLLELPEVPTDCSVLVVAGAHTDFLPMEKNKVRTFLQNGGAALFMLEPIPAPSFDSLLTEYGFKIGNDLVIDASGVGSLFGAGANMPVVTSYESHPIVENFSNSMTAFPVARSVQLISPLPGGITGQVLLKTSGNSWGETEFMSGGGRVGYDDGKDLRGPVPIASLVTKSVAPDSAHRISGKTRIAVFGDADFAANNYFNFQRNGDLFLNTISWLANEEDLVSIRPHDPEDRRISLTAKNSKIIMLVSVVLLPLSALIAAVVIYARRR
jgi:ABC-type uncharacterized transport system involved in gliding motility auxiliary subunit